MNKVFYLGITFWFLAINATSQINPDARRDYVWVFGGNPIETNASFINFNSNPPACTQQIQALEFARTNASVCDTSGNLLFYTNGMLVADKNGNKMPHGDSINYGPFYDIIMAQNSSRGYYALFSVIILPFPSQEDSIYCIFHSRGTYFSPFVIDLLLSKVNINQNNGLGDVVSKNGFIIDDTLAIGIDAIRHQNGRDWWIINTELNSSCYYITLLNPEGTYTYKQCIGNTNNYFDGAPRFSTDGTHLVSYIHGTGIHGIRYLQFDRNTGHLSAPIEFATPPILGFYNLSFSPNSRFLYASTGESLLQYDLLSVDIGSSMTVVSTMDSGDYHGYTWFITGPDGKIYNISAGGSTHMHVIASPDIQGLSCNVEKYSYNKHTADFSVPHFPNFRIGSAVGINENFANPEFGVKASPNPASDVMTFEMDVSNNFNPMYLEIYNTLSQQLQQEYIAPFQGLARLDVSSFAEGFYFAIFKDKGKAIATTKFIVSR